MKIVEMKISRFRGIADSVTIKLDSYNVFVGRNDVGKSTVLKALDLFLNDNGAENDMLNVSAPENSVEIEIVFECPSIPIDIDGGTETTFDAEKLVDGQGYLRVKKVWVTGKSTVKPEWFLYRKAYSKNDFLLSTESQLITLCKNLGIEAQKANSPEINNVEKRAKLHEKYIADNISFEHKYEKLATTGDNRSKRIFDALKSLLPCFEYFRADASLEESDTSIQKHFKQLASEAIKDSCGEIEKLVREQIGMVLSTITEKLISHFQKNKVSIQK